MAAANVAVEEEIYDSVKAAMVRTAQETPVGDANDPNVYMGPVISEAAVERINEFIERAEAEGGKVIVDGRNVKESLPEELQGGYFVGPTIIEGVTKDFEIAQEEVFGPVVSLIKIKNYKEGIELINDSKYGNGGSIFTESGVVEFFTKRKACTIQYFGPEDVDWTKDYISEFNVNKTE